ncbi:MAG: DUF1294 domain-containing protein [Euryarchaeota archaeon]|nr:DUF1294 domain-containing protein [Euryarchaeota archaeon]
MVLYQYVIMYLLAVNIVSFYLMGSDKRRARKGKYRIPERTLFFWATIGGSVGSIVGMQLFRHKTRHLSFRVWMPAILVVEAYMLLEFLLEFIV